MKKITLIAFALIAVSFGSCKKAKTCTCTTSSNGNVDITTVSFDKTSSGSANAACPKSVTTTDVQSSSGFSQTNVRTTTCVLS